VNNANRQFTKEIEIEVFHILDRYGQAPVAHTYNPSYSGGSDQQDRSLKPGRTNSPRDPVSKKKKKYHKIGLVVWLKL
jgi:hypothetical protein